MRDNKVNVLVIGAGQRGRAYAEALKDYQWAKIIAVAELDPDRRAHFSRRYSIAETANSKPSTQFSSWQEFVKVESERRKATPQSDDSRGRIDAALVCTLDDTHAEIIQSLAPFSIHILCEKPLATNWEDCLKIYDSIGTRPQTSVFAIGHVLRYSPHNILLRKLLLEEKVIGDPLSIEHAEPVGWWHFAHSYVRGNWRKESTSASSLLTKSCHDIDLLLWLFDQPSILQDSKAPHLPSQVASFGSTLYHKRSRKPKIAGSATNCFSCPAEPDCIYSANRIYVRDNLDRGNASWPVSVVDPEIEDLYQGSPDAARQRLVQRLGEDYDSSTTPRSVVESRPWFGRCVYESDNDVCDDQSVTIVWDDDSKGGFAKNALFHMVATTEAQCQRRGRIYGTDGEISYDSTVIRVFDFATRQSTEHNPAQPGGGHGGGDAGLARSFIDACKLVKVDGWDARLAQETTLGATTEDIVRSHGMVFAAEEARRQRRVVDLEEWWQSNCGKTKTAIF